MGVDTNSHYHTNMNFIFSQFARRGAKPRGGELVSSYLAPGAGLEPATNALTGRRSTIELPRNIFLTNFCILAEKSPRRKAAQGILFIHGPDPYKLGI